MKKLIIFTCLFLFSFILPKQVSASVIFFDDFESGNANQWTPLSGANIWHVENGKYGGILSTTSTVISTVAGDIPTPNYILEFDMTPIQGEDKNIDFRWRNNINNYDIHFNYTGGGLVTFWKAGIHQDGWSKQAYYFFPNNQISHIKIILTGQRIQFFINDNKIFDEVDVDYEFTSHEQVGLIIGTGGAAPTEIWFDNVKVTTMDDEVNLDVPLIKQTTEPWASQIYNRANLWNPFNPYIRSWGCAMTSANMILQYYKIDKLPNGNNLNPGTLNTWLNDQEDGYVGNGYINWLAISRLSKQAKQSGHNPYFLYDALEYSRVNGYNKNLLVEDINNQFPDILEEPGHFIVAKGLNSNTFYINDPYYGRTALDQGYSNTFLSLGRYIPSETDLSYFMIVLDQNTQIALRDSFGNPIGEQYIQEPLTNEINNNETNAPPIKISYYQKPESGNYQIMISSANNQVYNFKAYLYDKDGNIKVLNLEGIIGENTSEIFNLYYDKNDLNNLKLYKVVDFQSTIEDIKEGVVLDLINSEIAEALISHIKNAEKEYQKDQKNMIIQLNNFEKLLIKKQGKGVNNKAYQVLLYDVSYLKTHL